MNDNLVTIVKDGQLIITNEKNLCIDDLVFVQSGDLVPADLELVEARGLETDEFDITGEIMPVIKTVGDHDSILYMGSRITKGTGKGIVIATGEQTEYGKVLKHSWEQTKAYKLIFFDRTSLGIIGLLLPAFIFLFTQGLNIYIVIISILVTLLILVIWQNDKFFISLLVSNEQKKLEQFNVKIRDPKALEWMSRINMICFDKTGVLTTRHMEVKNIYYADHQWGSYQQENDESLSQLLNIACALCNDVLFLEKIDLANLIDKALIAFAQSNGIRLDELHAQYKRVYDQPFDSDNRFMACGFERKENEIYYFMKGDPGVIINRCTHYMTSTGVKRILDWGFFTNNTSNIEAINQSGDIVIALAFSSDLAVAPPATLTFLCLLQLQNSIQPGAKDLIRSISDRRIRSIMLTGDRVETAGRVAKECRITNNPMLCLTGRIIQYMPWPEVARQSAYCSVFARLLPSQKGALIRLFQQEGYSIAMIGDGPNDGIALKSADIGISFVKNSSPIARKLSQILINELADVLRLIEGSERLNQEIGNLEVIRLLAITGLIIGIYAYVLAMYFY